MGGMAVGGPDPLIFSHYNDEELAQRIAYWESCGNGNDLGILAHMYALRDQRVEDTLLAWVEGK